MSKELVVSSNRHETRVAILEDDQVVEVYFQRENEYSLAGSIHKGRVTRVLPGMQSAFVDIGLERDAFLYVSDFFEDNEEYEKVVSSVEDKVLKMDKTPDKAPAAAPVEVAAPKIEAPAEPEVAAPVSTPVVAEAPVREGREQRGDGRDRGDRRGRRSRRRRRGDGRGLPDSKYYTPSREQPAAHAPEASPAEEEEEEDLLVLPGESLAKYSGPEGPAAGEQDEEFHEGSETPVEAVPEREPAGVMESEASIQVEPDAALSQPEPEPAVEREPEMAAAAEPAEPQAERVPETEAAPAPAESELAEEPPAPLSETAAIEQTLEPQAEEDVEAQPEDPEAPPVESEEDADIQIEGDAENAAETETPVEAVSEDTPEPARIPTSLTATLREQGPRYLHRVSRRMRKRGRGGEDRRPEERRPEERRQPEARHDQRTAEVRTEQRPRENERAEKSDRPAQPSISDLLREGQEIIVQIAKEPLGQKGARITSHIALPGRFLVYMPTVDHAGVSRKIASDEERQRLKRIVQTHRAGIPGGFIVRTAGEGRSEDELRTDMMFLYNMWLDLRQKAEKRPAPALMHHDLDVVQRILRDQLTGSFKTIWVDNEEIYTSVLGFVQRFQPTLVSRVKLYTRPTPIFDQFNITQELEKALRPKVWLKSGGYIVINQTEALVAIDINTGKYVGKSNRLEDTIVKTNTDAIKEIVRQIRLRDLGGIIVVDFIDMDERKNRQKVMQALEEAMRSDRAPYKILQFNDFGLVAITRKRVKQSLERTLCSPCPTCEGAGYVKSVGTVVSEILQEAQKISKAVEGEHDVVLRVHPEVARFLKSNQNSYLPEIEEILGRNVIVKSDALLHPEKFDLA